MRRQVVYMVAVGALAALLGASRLATAANSEPCRISKGDSPVARACATGGLAGAKQSMKLLVKQARAGGARFHCDDCHSDSDRFDRLLPEAKQNFARLLAALPKTDRVATAP